MYLFLSFTAFQHFRQNTWTFADSSDQDQTAQKVHGTGSAMFFQGLMIVIATWFSPVSLLTGVSTLVCLCGEVTTCSGFERILCGMLVTKNDNK